MQMLATNSEERPQERLEAHGAQALSDAELLALLLRSGSASLDVMGLAQKLLHEAGSLVSLLGWSPKDFEKLPGIGKAKALQLVAIMEMVRRILIQKAAAEPLIDNASKAYEHLRPRCEGLEVEKFWTLCLNRKNHLIKCVACTSGTVSASLAHPREVFREAIRLNASAIIIAHNHPSGDPTPSTSDINLTRKLSEASKVLEIPLLDHIIVGKPSETNASGFYSFNEARKL